MRATRRRLSWHFPKTLCREIANDHRYLPLDQIGRYPWQLTMLDCDLSAHRPGDRLTQCEQPLCFFDFRNFGPRVEADEGRNE